MSQQPYLQAKDTMIDAHEAILGIKHPYLTELPDGAHYPAERELAVGEGWLLHEQVLRVGQLTCDRRGPGHCRNRLGAGPSPTSLLGECRLDHSADGPWPVQHRLSKGRQGACCRSKRQCAGLGSKAPAKQDLAREGQHPGALMNSSTVLVPAQQEREVVVRALVRHGAPTGSAEIQADWLVEADLRGHSSHGLARLPILVARMRRGRSFRPQSRS